MKTEGGNLVKNWNVMLFVLGFLVLLGGMILVMAGSAQSNIEGSFGAIIFIGPFPIVFGQGPQSPVVLVIGLMIAVVMALMFLSTVLSRRKVILEQ